MRRKNKAHQYVHAHPSNHRKRLNGGHPHPHTPVVCNVHCVEVCTEYTSNLVSPVRNQLQFLTHHEAKPGSQPLRCPPPPIPGHEVAVPEQEQLGEGMQVVLHTEAEYTSFREKQLATYTLPRPM